MPTLSCFVALKYQLLFGHNNKPLSSPFTYTIETPPFQHFPIPIPLPPPINMIDLLHLDLDQRELLLWQTSICFEKKNSGFVDYGDTI